MLSIRKGGHADLEKYYPLMEMDFDSEELIPKLSLHKAIMNGTAELLVVYEQESNLDLRLFLMSDAVTAGLRGQKPGEGYNIQQMLEILTAQNVPVKLCKTCTDGRGISTLPLIDGVEIGTLVELAQWTLSADKVLTF